MWPTNILDMWLYLAENSGENVLPSYFRPQRQTSTIGLSCFQVVLGCRHITTYLVAQYIVFDIQWMWYRQQLANPLMDDRISWTDRSAFDNVRHLLFSPWNGRNFFVQFPHFGITPSIKSYCWWYNVFSMCIPFFPINYPHLVGFVANIHLFCIKWADVGPARRPMAPLSGPPCRAQRWALGGAVAWRVGLCSGWRCTDLVHVAPEGSGEALRGEGKWPSAGGKMIEMCVCVCFCVCVCHIVLKRGECIF